MHLLQITYNITEMVQWFSALIAIIIALYFWMAYKKYTGQMERQKMLDQFLKD